ncbi:MAG: MFS transporter [Gemmataceae bacterium]|nr:MFS transporter [Gemmataceae bacterium]
MTVTESPEPTAPKKAMFIVFLVVVIDLLGFGIVLPLLPRYADLFIPAGTSKLMHGLIIGALFSGFSAMQFLFAPLWGRLSDRIGRRPVLLIGLAGSVAFYGLFGYASTLEEQARLGLILLFVSRIGAGLAGATISTAAAVIADCTTPEKRSRGMALIGAAFGLGFTFGPLIAWAGDKLLPDARSGPGYLAAALSAVALALAIGMMPETLRRSADSKPRELWRLRGIGEVLRMKGVGPLVASFFLAVFAFANFEATLALLTQSAFNYGKDTNYLIFAYVGASLMVAQGVIYRRLAGPMGELTLARIGIVLMLLGLANLAGIAAFAGTSGSGGMLAWFLVTLFVAVCGFAFVNPSINSLISKRADPTRQGEVLGVNQSASALARILGPAVGNMLFPLTTRHELPYVLAAGLLLLVLMWSPRLGDA